MNATGPTEVGTAVGRGDAGAGLGLALLQAARKPVANRPTISDLVEDTGGSPHRTFVISAACTRIAKPADSHHMLLALEQLGGKSFQQPTEQFPLSRGQIRDKGVHGPATAESKSPRQLATEAGALDPDLSPPPNTVPPNEARSLQSVYETDGGWLR